MRRLPRVRRRKVRVTHQAGGAARRRPPSRGRSCGGGGLRPPPAAFQRWKSLSKCPEPFRPGLGRSQTYPVLSSERADTWHTVPSADVGVGIPATERLRFGVFRMQRRVSPNGVHPCSLALQYFDGDEHLPATEGSPVVVPESVTDGQRHGLVRGIPLIMPPADAIAIRNAARRVQRADRADGEAPDRAFLTNISTLYFG